MQVSPGIVTFLFTDIEGSSRLWEEDPERMKFALARHDAISRAVVGSHHGLVVKTTGDGIYAAFDDPFDAVTAALALQETLANPDATHGLALSLRCGLHLGVAERRDNDFFGAPLNRAARIMAAAHGGQMLLSQAVAGVIAKRLRDGVTLRDLGTIRLCDLSSPEHVYQLVHPKLRADFPALRSLEGTPNNLPQQMSSFIGRKREQIEVAGLLANRRLVTLQGIGGMGKTRLSLQVAADSLEAFPDGVWLVELAALNDSRLVPTTVASVLGIGEKADQPLVETLAEAIGDRRSLIVLDNCEHLINACAEMAYALLRKTNGVRIIATSREALRGVLCTTFKVLPRCALDKA
jgi:class 3 adenylate cyclase